MKVRVRIVNYLDVLRFYQSGNSLRQTADKFNVSISLVRYAIKLCGSSLRGRKNSQKFGKKRLYGQNAGKPLFATRTFDYETAFNLYKSGKSLSESANLVGTSAETLRKALEVYGIPRRSRGTPKGKPNNPIRGGKRITASGYVYKRFEFRGDIHGLEHRIVAEKALGRKLRTGEIVHHINCDRSDNRNENLLICAPDYHVQLHARMAIHPYWSKF